jgi:hypothetical protein
VTVEAAPDGSIGVHERITGQTRPGATSFTRHVRSDRADRIAVTAVALDGQALRLDAARAQGIVEDGPASARIHFELTTGSGVPRVFDLRYRVMGAVGVEASRGRVVWPALPAERGFDVRDARLTFTVAEPAQILGSSGIAEAGWTVTHLPRGITAFRSGVGRDPATILADLSIDSRVISRPAWQVTEDLRGEFSLAFISGAVFVFVIGIGVTWIIRFQYPRIRTPYGPVDPDRRQVAHGLRTTGLAGGAFAIACGVVAQLLLGRFGWWAQLIPASMLLVALWFLIWGRWFNPHGPAKNSGA